MNLAIVEKFSFLLLTPYLVGWSSSDSSYSEYDLGIGGGQYATYDCAGKTHPNEFADAGVRVAHKFEGPFRVGLSASVVPSNGAKTFLAYPDLAIDSKYFSLGTTGVRLGSLDDLYGEVAFLDQIPFASGRGFLRAGIGARIEDETRLWVGMNVLPYNAGGAGGQLEFPISQKQWIFISGRRGTSGGVAEYGFSVGTRIRAF